jgi:hypothetical protein
VVTHQSFHRDLQRDCERKGAIDRYYSYLPGDRDRSLCALIAEKAYDSGPQRKWLRQRGIERICPHKKNPFAGRRKRVANVTIRAAWDKGTYHRAVGKLPAFGRALRPLAPNLSRVLPYLLHDRLTGVVHSF